MKNNDLINAFITKGKEVVKIIDNNEEKNKLDLFINEFENKYMNYEMSYNDLSLREIFDIITNKIKLIAPTIRGKRDIFIHANENGGMISLSLNGYRNSNNNFVINLYDNIYKISFVFEKSCIKNNKEIFANIKDEYYGTKFEYRTPGFIEKNHWIERALKVINEDPKRFLLKVLDFIKSIDSFASPIEDVINKYFPVKLIYDESYPHFIEDKMEEAWLKAFCIFVGYIPSTSFKKFTTDFHNERILFAIDKAFESLVEKKINKIDDHIKIRKYNGKNFLEVCMNDEVRFAYWIGSDAIQIYVKGSGPDHPKSIGYIEYNNPTDSFIFRHCNFKYTSDSYYPYEFDEIKSSLPVDFKMSLINILNIFETALERKPEDITQFLEDSFKVLQYIRDVTVPRHAIEFIAEQGIINFVKYKD